MTDSPPPSRIDVIMLPAIIKGSQRDTYFAGNLIHQLRFVRVNEPSEYRFIYGLVAPMHAIWYARIMEKRRQWRYEGIGIVHWIDRDRG
jgi:hypothetical protein